MSRTRSSVRAKVLGATRSEAANGSVAALSRSPAAVQRPAAPRSHFFATQSQPPTMQPTSEHRPSPVPGETVLSTWPNTKFFLSTTETSTWASLAAFHGVGTLRLTTCRLLFTVTPPSSSRAHLSIPLAWLRPEKLHIRRPFFDNKHISGLLTPCELHTPDPIFRFSKSMEFRLELLDVQVYDTLFFALRDLIADPQRLALHTRALRAQVDEKLVPTGNHFAFVDPTDPRYLHLATQMMHPTLP